MFERYSESARRTLFFARYEVTHLGGSSIEPEHILLGLIRERKGLVARILEASQVSLERIRREIEGRSVFRERIPTSVEIPFGPETQRVLSFAAEEADRLLHGGIGPEHLLLGLLREENSVAAAILGLRTNDVRIQIVKLLNETAAPSGSSSSAGLCEHIDRIKHLVEQLSRTQPETRAAHDLVRHIGDNLDNLKRYLGK
jgi:ATP-dependent Clp protease ATP-binding subunit ClpC